MTAMQNHLLQNKLGTAYQASVVYRDSVIWSTNLGRMTLNASSAKVSADSIFPVASVTKVITALMMYKLYNDGKISNLDQPIEEFAPTFKVRYPPGSHKITLRNLAGQLSGLKREAPCLKSTADNICPYNNSFMLDRLRNLSLLVKPGVQPHYSNLAFGVLGNALATWLQNTTYEEWVKEHLFKPLGMNNSFFSPTQEQKRNIPTGYMLDNKPQRKQDWGWLNPAAGMFSSVADLAKLQIMLFNSTPQNSYLSPIFLEEFFAPDYFFPDGETFLGTPWEMSTYQDGYVRRFKVGAVYGYSAYTLLIPELKLGFNMLCNKDSCAGAVPNVAAKELVEAFDEVLLKMGPKRLISPPNAAPYVGTFTVDNIPSVKSVRISEEKGQLYFIVNGSHKFYLTYKGHNSFELLAPEETPCLSTFITGVDHERLYFDSFSNETSTGFTYFGIHPNGLARFKRK